MALTKQELIDIISCDVQAVVLDKVQSFTDGWAKEFQKLAIEVKTMGEHDSNIIHQVNDHERLLEKFGGTAEKVAKLYTQFCENGYMQKFNSLAQMVNHFMVHRRDTCPFAGAIGDITDYINAQRDEAVRRAEGQLHTREQDRKAKRRWMIMALISFGGLLVAAGTLYGKIRGWW